MELLCSYTEKPMLMLISIFGAGLILSPLLYVLGSELWRLRSMRADIDEYEKTPEDASFTRKWIFGWRWKLQREVMRSAVKVLGDGFVTGFYRLMGLLFLVFLVAMWIGFLIVLIN